jgi:hypothetical protein
MYHLLLRHNHTFLKKSVVFSPSNQFLWCLFWFVGIEMNFKIYKKNYFYAFHKEKCFDKQLLPQYQTLPKLSGLKFSNCFYFSFYEAILISSCKFQMLKELSFFILGNKLSGSRCNVDHLSSNSYIRRVCGNYKLFYKEN